jgi:hypothetical protein
VADSPSSEGRSKQGERAGHGDLSKPGELFRSLAAHDRLATIGAAITIFSLLLPWYGVNVSGGLAKTGVNGFGFVQAALVLTAGSALALIVRTATGHRLPKPLNEGTLLAVAGAWSIVLIAYRMAARPEFDLPGAGRVALRYGIFVALAGALLLLAGGLRRRREEISAG